MPVLIELLRSDNDHVVKATATALRNLAMEETNRDTIALYGMASLIARLPVLQNPPSHEVVHLPCPSVPMFMDRHLPHAVSLTTASCILATIFTLINENVDNAS